MKNFFKSIAVAGVMSAALIGGPAQAENMKVLASWDNSYPAVGTVLTDFMKQLEANVDDLHLTQFGPETVPPFEQLDPVARGLFQILFTTGSYHYTDLSLGMALDTLKGDAKAWREAGIFDYLDSEYNKFGVKLLAVLVDPGGYQIVLKKPLEGEGLKGLRIRGTPSYHAAIIGLGGSPVVLPGSEIYPALERGAIDGAAWPAIGAVSFRWYEVADYVMRPTFGQTSYPLLINLDTWNGLDEKTRQQIETTAHDYEAAASDLFRKIDATEEKTLMDKGMKVTDLDEARSDILFKGWFGGQMDLAATINPDKIAHLRDLATKAGLSY